MYWSRGYQQLKKALIERYNLFHELVIDIFHDLNGVWSSHAIFTPYCGYCIIAYNQLGKCVIGFKFYDNVCLKS